MSLFIQLQEEKQKKEETEKKVQTLPIKAEKVCVFNLFTSEERTRIIYLGLRKGTLITWSGNPTPTKKTTIYY